MDVTVKTSSQVSNAIEKIDLITMLNLYHTQPHDRAFIEKECKERGKSAKTLHNKILFYYAKYLKNAEKTMWEEFIASLPIVEDVSEDTELHQAIRKNDHEKIKALVTPETDFSKTNKQGLTAFRLRRYMMTCL